MYPPAGRPNPSRATLGSGSAGGGATRAFFRRRPAICRRATQPLGSTCRAWSAGELACASLDCSLSGNVAGLIMASVRAKLTQSCPYEAADAAKARSRAARASVCWACGVTAGFDSVERRRRVSADGGIADGGNDVDAVVCADMLSRGAGTCAERGAASFRAGK